MDDVAASFLAALPGVAFAAVMIFSRIGSACIVLPGFGEAEIPMTVRIVIALTLLIALFPVLQPLIPTRPDDLVRLAGMVLAEVVTGLWFGTIARLWVLALPVAGQVISGAIGISNVIQPDPILGPQTSVLTRGVSVAAPALVFASGLYALPLRALAGSYDVVPAGSWLPIGDGVTAVVAAVGAIFALALRLSGPFVVVSVIWHAAIGLLARAVPQLQIYFAAMPAQILGGIAIFGLAATSLLAYWQRDVAAALAALPGR